MSERLREIEGRESIQQIFMFWRYEEAVMSVRVFGCRLRLLLALAVVVVTLAAAGLARASVKTIDELAAGALVPSAAPSLLGPINMLGRTGWDCAPERAARADRAGAAQLPDDAAR